jgi:hypothetical protein
LTQYIRGHRHGLLLSEYSLGAIASVCCCVVQHCRVVHLDGHEFIDDWDFVENIEKHLDEFEKHDDLEERGVEGLVVEEDMINFEKFSYYIVSDF